MLAAAIKNAAFKDIMSCVTDFPRDLAPRLEPSSLQMPGLSVAWSAPVLHRTNDAPL